jgi:hypothetical protein
LGAVISAAGGKGGFMESVYGSAVRRREGNMHAGLRRRTLADPEEGFFRHAVTGELPRLETLDLSYTTLLTEFPRMQSLGSLRGRFAARGRAPNARFAGL